MHNTIKSFAQNDYIGKGSPSKDGICYYLCNFIDEKLWNSLKDYEEGEQKSRSFIPLDAINYAKAQNLLYKQQDGYVTPFRDFQPCKLYRMSFCIAEDYNDVEYDDDKNPLPTHEVILITGSNCVLLFDPNEGFLKFNSLEVMPVIYDRKEYYRYYKEVSNFKIKMIRNINSSYPLGFSREPMHG